MISINGRRSEVPPLLRHKFLELDAPNAKVFAHVRDFRCVGLKTFLSNHCCVLDRRCRYYERISYWCAPQRCFLANKRLEMSDSEDFCYELQFLVGWCCENFLVIVRPRLNVVSIIVTLELIEHFAC